MNTLRKSPDRKLRELGVEQRPWPGREGFASLFYKGKAVIRRERLSPLPDSTVHPDRAKGSAWYEMRIATAADVEKSFRLVQLAIDGLKI